MTAHATTLRFDVQISVKYQNDEWTAFVAPPGVMVVGETRGELDDRVNQALDFFLSAFNKYPDAVDRMRMYLDSHAVKHTITDTPEEPVVYSRPMNMEALVNA